MKYKNKEDMKEHIDNLGICALSKFSAINHLSKLGIPLEGMIAIESMVRSIECKLWTLIPLGLGNDEKTFKEQIDNLNSEVKRLIESAKVMKSIIK